MSTYTEMLQGGDNRGRILSYEEINHIHYPHLGINEENRNYDRGFSSDVRNHPLYLTPDLSVPPHFIKPDPEYQSDRSIDDCQRVHYDKIQHIVPFPRFLEDMDKTLQVINDSLHWEEGRENRRVVTLQLDSLEAQKRLQKKELNKRRKALKRAQETEEEKRARREKERLRKAAQRAAEPLEKRILRRERDRIAKALARAMETEEQRSIRREQNRISKANMRAAQTEEEKLINRQKDRIKRARIRAIEAEERKRLRRENRIAMSLKRNLNDRERNCLKNVN